jgi:hypothetical protein
MPNSQDDDIVMIPCRPSQDDDIMHDDVSNSTSDSIWVIETPQKHCISCLYDFHVLFTLGVEVRLYARENGPGDSLRIVALSPLGKNFTKNYAPQTKILEGLTKDEIRIFRYTLQWFVAQIEYSHP